MNGQIAPARNDTQRSQQRFQLFIQSQGLRRENSLAHCHYNGLIVFW